MDRDERGALRATGQKPATDTAMADNYTMVGIRDDYCHVSSLNNENPSSLPAALYCYG